MDLDKLLEDLRQQKDKIQHAIRLLEELHGSRPSGSRGRKFMDGEERRLVSARMKTYWEKQRSQKEPGKVQPANPNPRSAPPAPRKLKGPPRKS